MCVLVISNYFETPDPGHLVCVSTRINEVIDDARVNRRRVAFIQYQNGSGFNAIGVKVGRYEPVFTAGRGDAALSAGLIEFIVRYATTEIDLAGVASLREFERIRGSLRRSGYATKIDPRAAIMQGSSRNDELNAC